MIGLSKSNLSHPSVDEKLGLRKAVLDALLSRKCDFYPLHIQYAENSDTYSTSSMDTKAVLAEMREETRSWSRLKAGDDLSAAIDLAKRSLEEVKAQTEYQDEKATRLLTVATFLSVLSGALFSQLETMYPFGSIEGTSLFGRAFVGGAYLIFLASIMTSLSGALVIFHATRTRFKRSSEQTNGDFEKDPRSLLFFSELIRSRPKAWARGWVAFSDAGSQRPHPVLRKDLEQRYFENLVTETYLIAAKTADKVRYLEPAQSLLAISLRCLLLWLVVLTVIVAFLPSTKPQSPNPTVSVAVTTSLPYAQALPIPVLRPATGAPPSVGTSRPHDGKEQL